MQDAVSNYKLLEVTKSEIPLFTGTKWDGILGLLPTSVSGSEVFVSELYKQGKLAEEAFAVYYTDTYNQSEITFGGFDTNRVKDKSLFTFLRTLDKFFWSAKLNGVKYGNTTEIKNTARDAVLDSGTSLILLPTAMYDEFKSVVSANRTCGTMGVYYGCL